MSDSFEYKVEIDGTPHVLTLKPIEEVPMGIAMLGDYGDNEAAQARDMLRWALSEEDFELMKRVPMGKALAMIEAWQAGMTGTGLGESVASSISSRGTARPSKPTSSRSDSD